MCLIALDIGTSGARAVLYDLSGGKMTDISFEYHSDFPAPGYVEQDPETWKEAAIYCLQGVGGYVKAHGIRPEAIAVTSQRSSLIPADKKGRPLRSAIMWQDKRTIPQCSQLSSEYTLKSLYLKTGLRINPYFVLPKILWLRENQREIYNSAFKFLGVQDYVIHCLTGEYKTDCSQACRTMLMNIETFRWDQELLNIAGISENMLPELLPPGSIAGFLIGEVAEKVQLPSGLPVIMSGGDQQNAAVALGVIKPGLAEANTGTGSFVISAVGKPVFDQDSRVLCQASAIPGQWIMEAGIFNSGSIYRWFKEQFYPELKNEKHPYEIMDREAGEVQTGSNGVIMIPHFEGSAAPYWNPIAKGLFFNLSLGLKRAALTRSILEGIAIEIHDNISLIENLTGAIETVSVAGGMVRSDLFCSIQASVYNKKVARYQNTEASSLGAAITAAARLGIYRGIEEAYYRMLQDGPYIFYPVNEDAIKYSEIIKRKNILYGSLNSQEIYKYFV